MRAFNIFIKCKSCMECGHFAIKVYSYCTKFFQINFRIFKTCLISVRHSFLTQLSN